MTIKTNKGDIDPYNVSPEEQKRINEFSNKVSRKKGLLETLDEKLKEVKKPR